MNPYCWGKILWHSLKTIWLGLNRKWNLRQTGTGGEVEFKEGEWALVKLQLYWQFTLAHWLNNKLSQRYFRPFHIKKKILLVDPTGGQQDPPHIPHWQIKEVLGDITYPSSSPPDPIPRQPTYLLLPFGYHAQQKVIHQGEVCSTNISSVE